MSLARDKNSIELLHIDGGTQTLCIYILTLSIIDKVEWKSWPGTRYLNAFFIFFDSNNIYCVIQNQKGRIFYRFASQHYIVSDRFFFLQYVIIITRHLLSKVFLAVSDLFSKASPISPLLLQDYSYALQCRRSDYGVNHITPRKVLQHRTNRTLIFYNNYYCESSARTSVKYIYIYIS